MNSVKSKYQALCDVEPSIPLFSRAWWLDAAAGKDDWNVVLIEEDGSIVAAMPYAIQHRFGFTLLTHPPLTQTLGPWLKPSTMKNSKQLSRQKELMAALIAGLPPFDYYAQRWHYSNTNWLPFYWAGFKQTTRYTYVIDDLSDLSAVFAGFSAGKRKDIKKAEKSVTVKFDISAEEFYSNHKMTLAQQNAKISYPFEVFKRMYDSGYQRNSACTIAAYDGHNNLHAALFIVWDQNSAYDLISTIDPRYRNSGAASLLVHEAILHVSTKTKKFDFEGSMIEPVEHSFRQFNTVQVPYFAVSKSRSKALAIAKLIHASLHGIKR
ncbi:GNAT family N-acetyltransferase [Allopusillimonas ginsengisoli]|uniref:GNAT family N-acetyltransferase n=1 Tax=Allopusillimonas ginsengisoli TaxID=453575 RepID=UPI0039C0529E